MLPARLSLRQAVGRVDVPKRGRACWVGGGDHISRNVYSENVEPFLALPRDGCLLVVLLPEIRNERWAFVRGW